jgi:hypothetical protein
MQEWRMANAEKLWDRLAAGWDKRTDLGTPCVGAKASAAGRVLVLVAKTLSGLRLIPSVRFFRVAGWWRRRCRPI